MIELNCKNAWIGAVACAMAWMLLGAVEPSSSPKSSIIQTDVLRTSRLEFVKAEGAESAAYVMELSKEDQSDVLIIHSTQKGVRTKLELSGDGIRIEGVSGAAVDIGFSENGELHCEFVRDNTYPAMRLSVSPKGEPIVGVYDVEGNGREFTPERSGPASLAFRK